VIDLHCHLLPGLDDGAKNLDTSLRMAAIAADDGIQTIVCTPHILPGVYNNKGPDIRQAVGRLEDAIGNAGIPIRLLAGADVHIAPNLSELLRNGQALSINGSRYFLFEPPHHVLPPRMDDHVFGLQAAGLVPILTHPERLTWIENNFGLVKHLVRSGVMLQITAGAMLGRFGSRPKYWAERILDEGLCHLLATDAHDPERRPPILSKARDAAARRLGEEEAVNLVYRRPKAVVENLPVAQVPALPQPIADGDEREKTSFLAGVLRRVRSAM